MCARGEGIITAGPEFKRNGPCTCTHRFAARDSIIKQSIAFEREGLLTEVGMLIEGYYGSKLIQMPFTSTACITL